MSRFPLLLLIAASLLAAPAAQAEKHFDKSDQDTTCAPCKDFDQYANGGWRARFVMPASYSRYGAFTEVADRNQQVLYGIVTKAAAAKAKMGTDDAKLGDYWSSCMDSVAAEAAGMKPVQPLLTAVDDMKSVEDLARQGAWFHAHGVGAMFAWFGNQDPKNSDRFIVHAGQGGLHLPDRDYYTKTDSASKALRTEYVAHMARCFVLAGEEAPLAATHADHVMGLETALANASMTNVQRRDPNATYHVMPVDSLVLLAPKFNWKEYFAGRAKTPDIVNVTQ